MSLPWLGCSGGPPTPKGGGSVSAEGSVVAGQGVHRRWLIDVPLSQPRLSLSMPPPPALPLSLKSMNVSRMRIKTRKREKVPAGGGLIHTGLVYGFETSMGHRHCLTVQLPRAWSTPRGSQISKALVPPMGPGGESSTGPAC